MLSLLEKNQKKVLLPATADRLVIHTEGKLFITLNVCTHIHSADEELQLLVLLVWLICKYTKSSVRKEFTLIFSQGFKIFLTYPTGLHTWYKETGLHSSRNCGTLLKQRTRTRAPACPNTTMWKGDPPNMVSQKRKLDTQNLCWEVLKKTTLYLPVQEATYSFWTWT